MLMIEKKSNGKYYLLSEGGYILHSESTLQLMWEYVKEQFAGTYSKGEITVKEA